MTGRRRRAAVTAVAVATLAAAAAALLVPRSTTDEPGRIPPPAETVAPRTELSPRAHAFGDTVTATLEVVVDPSAVDPDEVEIALRFDPYTPLDDVTAEREDRDGLVVLRRVARLQCLELACVAPGRQAVLALPNATVRYPLPTTVVTLQVAWPPLVVASRLRGDASGGPAPLGRALPAATTRIDAELLGWLLAAVSSVLVAAAGALALGALAPAPGGPDPAPGEPVDARDPLEEALVRVERGDGEVAERRLAVDALARAAESSGLEGVAARARRLAWSAAPPDPAAMRELAKAARDGEEP